MSHSEALGAKTLTYKFGGDTIPFIIVATNRDDEVCERGRLGGREKISKVLDMLSLGHISDPQVQRPGGLLDEQV